MASIEEPLQQLAVLEQNGRLLVRLDDGIADDSGQRHFDFDDDLGPMEVRLPQSPATAEQLFEKGSQHEERGRLNDAVDAYRQAPLGKKEQAVERYYQAVELDCKDVDAWNNLGVVLADLGHKREAIAAFEQTLAIEQDYAEAHYNLADLLDESGRQAEAAAHWRAYSANDWDVWTAYARERLTASGFDK
jgi:tetratricopeptide (TPR) repeat protein